MLSDITIPFGLSSHSQRYRYISDILDENHNISEVICHSLGSSASARYLKDNPDRNIRLTTYGAPFISMSSKNDDGYTNFRSGGDVIGIFDRGSIQTSTNTYNPLVNHQYTCFFMIKGKNQQ